MSHAVQRLKELEYAKIRFPMPKILFWTICSFPCVYIFKQSNEINNECKVCKKVFMKYLKNSVKVDNKIDAKASINNTNENQVLYLKIHKKLSALSINTSERFWIKNK